MKSIRITDVPGLNQLWKFNNLYLAGQPDENSLENLKENFNIKKVFNLRGESEMDFSWEERKLEELGIDYEQFPIVTEVGLDSENCKKLSEQVNEQTNNGEELFIHCGSANRVAGWLITYLVNYKNMSFDDAVEIAESSGLTNPAFIDQAEKVLKK